MTRVALFVSAVSLIALAACGEAEQSSAAGEMATEAAVAQAATEEPAPVEAAAAEAEAAPAAEQEIAPEHGDGGEARVWTVDHSLSTLAVTGDYGAKPFTGTFSDWSADIVFGPEDLAASSISVAIQVASWQSGDSDRDSAAQASRWLNSAEFPTATWESTSIEASGDAYVGHGIFTIAGVTSPLDLNFTVEIDGDTAHAIGTTTFDHHDVGITGGYDDTDTGDIFTVNFDITATAQ